MAGWDARAALLAGFGLLVGVVVRGLCLVVLLGWPGVDGKMGLDVCSRVWPEALRGAVGLMNLRV